MVPWLNRSISLRQQRYRGFLPGNAANLFLTSGRKLPQLRGHLAHAGKPFFKIFDVFNTIVIDKFLPHKVVLLRTSLSLCEIGSMNTSLRDGSVVEDPSIGQQDRPTLPLLIFTLGAT